MWHGDTALQNVTAAKTARSAVSLAASAAKLSLPWGWRLSLVTGLDEIAALQEGWCKLQKTSALPHNVFQSFEWCMAWAETYAREDSRSEPCIVTGYQDNRLVFVWPLMIVQSGPIRTLRWLTEPFSQYGDVLVAKQENPRTWLSASVKLLSRLKSIDAIRLRHVREDAAAYAFLSRTFRSEKSGDFAPYMDLTRFPNEAAYEARYTKEQRKRRKRIRKTLEEMGPVEFTLLESGSLMDRANDEALSNKVAWLKERDLFYRVLDCPKLLPFLKKLSRDSSGDAKVVTSVLTAGGKPISWEIGLRFGNTHFGFITAHDVAMTDASPARLHMDLAQRRALADGMNVFDLMVPMDPHKQSWSSAVIPVHDFQMPLSVKGWLYGILYVERIRPALRKLYYDRPNWTRPLVSAGMKMKALLSL
jgi:CelD/BcsL family acetyltransferase involved in cellulose biosynthesis